MTIFSSEVKQVFRNIKNTLRESLAYVSPEQKLENEARKSALESVRMFIDSSNQLVKAEFKANSKNLIDLSKEKPGSIFRSTAKTPGTMYRHSGNGESSRWYVLGNDANGKVCVWEISQESTGRIPQNEGELRIPQDDIELTKVKLESLLIKPAYISKQFHKIPLELEKPIKVDRMWGGVPERNSQRTDHRVAVALKKLSLAPQTV